jgi:predicted metal-dependent hydrolase
MPEEATGKRGVPSERRNKPERPRDELGRPQAWGAENRLRLEDFDSMPLQENHRLAREHFNAGRFFPAHEAWETAWKQARGSEDAEFFKGLSQLGAGYVHLLRGNAHGAMQLLRRAARRVGRYPSGTHGVDTGSVAAAALADADEVERGTLVPGIAAAHHAPRV